MVKRLRTRRWPWQYSTPSWPAAYNLACVYAAIYAYRNHQLEACMRKPENKQAKHKADQIKESCGISSGKWSPAWSSLSTTPSARWSARQNG